MQRPPKNSAEVASTTQRNVLVLRSKRLTEQISVL